MNEISFENVTPAPEFGVDINNDIIETAFNACMSVYEYNIKFLLKSEQDQIYAAVRAAWSDWPNDNEAAWQAAPTTLKSLAVAGGWVDILRAS